MNDPSGEVSLIRRIVRQDDEALRWLYALYGQRMFAYALRLTGHRALAEDVVQDSLVIIWRTAHRYREQGRLIAWLLGIVHHTAIKALRHCHQPLDVEQAESLPADDPLPEELVRRREESERLRLEMSRLSPDHRAALELVFFLGMSLAEAARVCGCPLGTIKSRLSYARRYLREALERDER